jgi:hypothetical protein
MQAATRIIERGIYPKNTNIVMDAAFGSLEIIEKAATKGINITASVNTGVQQKWFWDLMRTGLSDGEGRVMANGKGITASIFP